MKKNLKPLPQSGFTLIEILIVIGVIAILAAIVLVAVNPAKQFREASNAQRSSNVNAILNAVSQYMVDNKGLGDLDGEIDEGEEDALEIGKDDADLCELLVPTYIAKLPVDPGMGDPQSIPAEGDNCDDDYATGYYVYQEGDRITVTAPDAEGGTISVTR